MPLGGSQVKWRYGAFCYTKGNPCSKIGLDGFSSGVWIVESSCRKVKTLVVAMFALNVLMTLMG